MSRRASFLVSILVLTHAATAWGRSQVSEEVYDCDTTDGWIVVDRQARPVSDSSLTARGGTVVLDYPRSEPRLLAHHAARLTGMKSLSLRLRSRAETLVAVSVEDRDGARFFALVPLPAGEEREVVLATRQFRLAEDSPVHKERLDSARLAGGYVLFDAASLRGASGRNTLRVDRVAIRRPAVAVREEDLTVDGRLTLSESERRVGDIVVEESGHLVIRAPRYVLAGNLIVEGGSVEIEGTALDLPSRFNHEREHTLRGGSQMTVTDAHLTTDFPFDLRLSEGSSLDMRDSEVQGVMTVTQSSGAKVKLTRVQSPGEFIVCPDCPFEAEGSRDFLIWLVLGPQFRGELRFPDGREVESWSARPVAEVEIRDSHDVLWALLSTPGALGAVVSSTLRAVASIFLADDEVTIRNLHNGSLPPDGVLDTGDRRLEFRDSTVGAWNFYVDQKGTLTLEDSTVGEAWGFGGEGSLTLRRTTCDGSGGNVRAQGRTRLVIQDSEILSNVVADGEAEVVIENSTVHDDIHAVGSSRVTLIDSQVIGRLESDPPAVIVER